MDIKDRVLELLEILSLASDSYYNKSESIITDAEYDSLKEELQTIYTSGQIKDKGLYSLIHNYLNQIGSVISEDNVWKKTKHNHPMASLEKVTNNSEHEDFAIDFRKWAEKTGDKTFVIFDKMDGISIDLVYENGNLIQAVTRGDGEIGEDIYDNVIQMKHVKKSIPGFTGNIYGEIVLFRDDFEELNRLQLQNNKKLFKNPRNAASGIAKNRDGVFAKYLSVLCYNIKGIECKSELDKIKQLVKMTTPCYWSVGTLDDIISTFHNYENNVRVKLPYDIDGMVIRCNDLVIQERLGYLSSGNPHWSIAWKFDAMKAEAIVKDIEWSLSNKRVTPVLIVEPVYVGGVTVRRVTLHNLDIFNKFNLGVGDKVSISRRGDVIPAVESVIAYSNSKRFKAPEKCPICDEILDCNDTFLLCTNNNCSGSKIGDLKKWIKVLDINGLGDVIIEELYTNGLVNNPANFYTITIEEMASITGEKIATKIIKNLKAKMELTLEEFIAGLNISNCSDGTTRSLIAGGLKSIEDIQKATKEDLININGIGETTANAIINGLNDKNTIINELFNCGITIKETAKKEIKSGHLSGKTFVFTGAIQAVNNDGKRLTREDMHNCVLSNGGMVADSIKKGVDYLVQADPNSVSSKSKKAKEVGVTILSEKDFFKMI